ncbi:hypothetical protein ASZ90_020278 [hydrocarbon metagenome]|uniref:VCBS repeat-containing protein n=1 Tax=hydrocarbon metagenome TaxID=938273 RepID=A0A0W8E146_9ZZZZ
MIIENSWMEMSSARTYREELIKEESSRMWIGTDPSESKQEQAKNPFLTQDSVEISAAAEDAKKKEFRFELNQEDKYKISLLKSLLEVLTGKRIKFYLPVDMDAKIQDKVNCLSKNAPQQNIIQRAGWGFEYDYYQSHFESEQTSFSASAVVKTADGREINISLNLNMSRSFSSHTELHIRAGDAQLADPLVINFDGPAAALTERSFEFDLDNDGEMDIMSFLNPGSGFLALDLNGDGIINDGRELFGPRNGDGFAQLTEYDEDGNGWIDENDAVFDRLRIWTKDSTGNDVLFGLGQKGIGAICLTNISTSFALKNSNNELNGQVISSGMFLRENGTAGTIQQIDLRI